MKAVKAEIEEKDGNYSVRVDYSGKYTETIYCLSKQDAEKTLKKINKLFCD